MGAIATWFAGKTVQIVAAVLAVVGAILIPVTAWQTVQLYGAGFSLPIIGHVVLATGAIQDAKDADARAAKSESNYQTAKGNTDRCYVKLDAQSDKIAKDSAQSTAALATASQKLTDAQKKAAVLAAKLAAFQAQAPAGATVCARVEDVDRRFLETLP
jgi:hypothetical protein